jgi:hypothetical protein
MISLAVVGTEGSGKTVLTTVLAKRYSIHKPGSPFFEALSKKTLDYVENGWQALNNGEWPESTALGELPQLQWKVHFGEDLCCELKMSDTAGQDLRELFGTERVRDYNTLPKPLKDLTDVVMGADILVVLLNLKDFLGDADPGRQNETIWTTKYLLDCIQKSRSQIPPQIAIVLTQIDQYGGILKNHPNLAAVIEAKLPMLYVAHFTNGSVTPFGIASVATTEVSVNSDQAIGRVPSRPITSIGLDELMNWICTAAESIANRPDPPPDPQTEVTPESQVPFGYGVFWIAVAIILTAWWLLTSQGKTEPKPLPIDFNKLLKQVK